MGLGLLSSLWLECRMELCASGVEIIRKYYLKLTVMEKYGV